MPVLLAVLKGAAVLVALVAVVLVVALLLPLGFAVEYHRSHLRISAVYGPFRRVIWSHRLRWPTLHRELIRVARPAAETPSQPAASAPDTEPAPPVVPVEPQTASQPSPSAPPDVSEKPGEAPAAPVPEEEEEVESGTILRRLERMVEVTAEDPKAMANCILGHMRWLQKHSFFKIHVRHLYVFWTVTCEDAARTAIAYGAEMTALNTALALLQQSVRLQSDRLWLEPDFTGARRSERKISCTVSASAILMFHLLYRIWTDPLLKPQATEQSEPKTT